MSVVSRRRKRAARGSTPARKAVFDRVAHLYDGEHRGFKRDISFYVSHARKCRGEVLELACGTCRVLVPVARAGKRITGLEISPKMLGIARNKIDRLNADVRRRITLVQGDMSDFNLRRKFGLIIIAFRSFQSLVDKQAQRKCLICINRHLKKNGRLIIDLFAPRHDYLARGRVVFDLEKFYDETLKTTVSRRAETTYDLARQTLACTISYRWVDKNGRRRGRVWAFDLGYLFRYEMELLLEKYGFKVVDVFGDFNRAPYNYYSGEQVFLAKKG